jgi:hypothetical protein
MMAKDPLDRILSEEEILPSAGFAASVMEAVRHEAAAPAPLAFPWKRAWPGLAVAGLTVALVIVAAIAQLFRGPVPAAPLPAWTAATGSMLQAIDRAGGLWALAGLLVSVVCVKLSMSFGIRRA